MQKMFTRHLLEIIKKSANSIFHVNRDQEVTQKSNVFNKGEIALTLTLVSIGLMLLGSAAGVMQSKNVQQFFGRAAESCTYDYTISVFLDRQGGTLLSSSQNGGRAVQARDGRSPAGPETLSTGTVTRNLTTIAPYTGEDDDNATVTLGNLSNDLEVASTFCEDSGTASSCPTNTNQRSKVFANFRPKCGAKINYGWVVKPLTISGGDERTITLAPTRPSAQNTAAPTTPVRLVNSPTPRATAAPACSFKAVFELQDQNGNVLTNVSGATWSNKTAAGPSHGSFPSTGPARININSLPNSNHHNTFSDWTLQLPPGYMLAQASRSFFCDYGRGAFGACTRTTAADGGLTIKDIGLICGADMKYGWKLIRTSSGGPQPTASAQSGSGSINVRTYVVISDERPSGNLCDANFLKSNLNKRVNDSRGKSLADVRSYEGECRIGARLLGSRTYANKMERNPGDTHIPSDRRVGCGFFGLHQLPVGQYNVEFLDKDLLPSADPGKPNELDVVCSNAASNLNVTNGAQAEAAIVLWPKPSKACETTSGSNCTNKPGFSQTARMSKNETTGVGYETLCCKDKTEQPQSGGPGCYCTNAGQCGQPPAGEFYTPSYCSIAGDGLCCKGGVKPKPEQLVPPAVTGVTRPSGTPAGSCSGSFTTAGVKFNLSCQSQNDCAASSGARTPSLGSCIRNEICCSVPEKKDTPPQSCSGKTIIKGAEFALRCASRSDCDNAGGVGMSGVGDCKINSVCCAVKPEPDGLPTSCTGSTSSRTFSCSSSATRCEDNGGTVVDLPGCTKGGTSADGPKCCAKPRSPLRTATGTVTSNPRCEGSEDVNGTNSRLDCAIGPNTCRDRNGGTGVVMTDKRNCANVCCAEPNIASSSVNSAVVSGNVSVDGLGKLIDDSDRDAFMLYSCTYTNVTTGVFGGVKEDKKTHATIEFDESEDLDFEMSTIIKDDTNHVKCSGGASYNDRRGKLTIVDDGKINESIGRNSDLSTSIRIKYESFNRGDSSSDSLGFDTTSGGARDRQSSRGGSIVSFETIGSGEGAYELSLGMCQSPSSQCYGGGFLSFDGEKDNRVFVNIPEGLTRSTLNSPSCTLRVSGNDYPCSDFSILDNEVNYLVKTGDSLEVTTQSGLADINGDGEVNSIDFLTLTGNYELDQYDLNLDGQTNAMDVDASRTWLGTSLTN